MVDLTSAVDIVTGGAESQQSVSDSGVANSRKDLRSRIGDPRLVQIEATTPSQPFGIVRWILDGDAIIDVSVTSLP